ncbi:TPA: hypothetical protein U1C28_001999 [Streptococcus suis]|uniref:hypothetical protein n=1 Tax=Streptococcus sp. A18 TaxID=3373125 RepID=UPI002AA48F40|nr:hypothetical protein [Streptococcus suis]HEM3608908.1 hypothetical protein [Streptococcus suis]HEM3647283.1 hypothetical protein [Streptococcus suis]HEM3711748.1 hypothetical protein [Streptococcus suis]
MKKRRIFISLVVAITILILGGCGMTSQKETLTKVQQDNVVKRIARGYNIQSIEFTAFSKDKKTGTYLLNIKINNSDSLETTIPFRNLERLSNDSDAIGLNPIDDFQTIQKSQLLENVDISRIKVIYLEE